MAAITSDLTATIGHSPRVKTSIPGLAGNKQNNKMAKTVKFLILIACVVGLFADVAFIVWATKLNLLIVVPAVLSAVYLSYVAAYWTVLK